MNDLPRMIDAVRQDLNVRWDAERESQNRQGITRKRRRRRVVRTTLGSVATLACIGLGSWLTLPNRSPSNPTHSASVTSPAVSASSLTLADGSLVTFADPTTKLIPIQNQVDSVRVRLGRGSARFAVPSRQNRRFVVQSQDVEVWVVGTLFEVTQHQGGTTVAVTEGQVRVRQLGRETLVAAGETEEFPIATDPEDDITNPLPAAPKGRPWRALLKDGSYHEAYRALTRAGPEAVKDKAVILMDAADAARLSGHPREAVGYLRRVVERHSTDPLAPLAAFTLGRIWLEELGEPRQAATSFAQARRLAPTSPLAQDALAREVEAWSKASDLGRAHERAVEFIERYPDSRRKAAVRAFGGLD